MHSLSSRATNQFRVEFLCQCLVFFTLGFHLLRFLIVIYGQFFQCLQHLLDFFLRRFALLLKTIEFGLEILIVFPGRETDDETTASQGVRRIRTSID